MVENSILRKNAREQLGNNIFDKTWLMLTLVYLIYSAVIGAAGGYTLGIASFILYGPIVYGVNRICVNLVRGKREIALEEMLVGFKENFAQSLLVYLMTTLFTVLWSLLLIVPGIIKYYSYAMAPYILQDDPSKEWRQCIDESQEMMKGNKWQLFCLDFSFLGWMIVGFLCCCVGVLFVYPYQLTARANFYMALKAKIDRERGGYTDGGSSDSDSFSEPVDPFN